jgi:hypothetical protein
MAKSQKKSNREIRKPKAEKPKPGLALPPEKRVVAASPVSSKR